MEDFTALAASLAAGVGDVRGCLVLSRDGLVLGAYPEGAEDLAKPAWLRFAALGEPERGFVQFGTEVWCYARRGAYAAFTVAQAAVRAGLVIDQMEQALMAAEEARSKREGLHVPDTAATSPTAPSSKPRTPLHPEPRSVDEPVVIHAEVPAAAGGAEPVGAPAADDPAAAETAGGWQESEAAQEPEPAASPGSVWATPGDQEQRGEEVERALLAKELSELLQDGSDTADG